jgi:glycerate 2-kinase
MKEPVTSRLVTDANAISAHWRSELDLDDLVAGQLRAAGVTDQRVDVVAIGKASREMAAAARRVLGPRMQRQLIVCDEQSALMEPVGADVVIGEHPVPGAGSWRAGRRLLDFLGGATDADCTLFLLSGGASSLCVWPEPPLEVSDLRALWEAALASGADITTLNQIRAATSRIAGGGVLRHVRTPRSQSLILVDNVISGARWVASGLTYDYTPTPDEVASLVARIDLTGSLLAERLLGAFEHRLVSMAAPVRAAHENLVVAQPSLLADHARAEALRRGYRVVDMGSDVHGDVRSVGARWSDAIRAALAPGDAICVVGVGEVTVQVNGEGLGGRCQEFAWLMAGALAPLERESAFVARASDGCDYLEGVGGAWVDGSTRQRAEQLGFDWDQVLDENDSFSPLSALGQLLVGGHTGWNLCDLYVACVGEQRSPDPKDSSP